MLTPRSPLPDYVISFFFLLSLSYFFLFSPHKIPAVHHRESGVKTGQNSSRMASYSVFMALLSIWASAPFYCPPESFLSLLISARRFSHGNWSSLTLTGYPTSPAPPTTVQPLDDTGQVGARPTHASFQATPVPAVYFVIVVLGI